MRPLTEADVRWLEGRIGVHRWTVEDCGRMVADLRASREHCALACLDLIDETEREHMIYTIPGYDLGSGLAKIACAEAIRKGQPCHAGEK
jgi:hypothetical protein